MTDMLTVPASEIGKVRLFALNMPPEQARFLQEPGAVDGVLGGMKIDPAYVDIFPVTDLQDLGLPGYLTEGCGIPADQIAPDRARLESLTGYVLLILSRAFGGNAVTLTPAPGLDLVATYSTPSTDWTATRIPTDSAGVRAGSQMSPRATRRRARRIGGAIFATFMVIILAMILLVAR